MNGYRWSRTAALGAVIAVFGCGGGDDSSGTAAAPAAAPGGDTTAVATATPAPAEAPATAQATDSTATTTNQADSAGNMVRETFSYRGSGRDPFLSLLKSGDVRPLLQDLRVTGITYDSRYPARSVAVMRDTTQGKPYAVRVGDELGRIRIAEIRRGEIVITYDDFGVERQIVLSVRKRQEETP